MQLYTIKKATITYRPYHRNYYHSLAESIFAVHSLSCTYYGYCSYGDGSDMHAIFLDSPEDPFDWDATLPSAVEALHCLTPHHAITTKNRKLRNKVRMTLCHTFKLLVCSASSLVCCTTAAIVSHTLMWCMQAVNVCHLHHALAAQSHQGSIMVLYSHLSVPAHDSKCKPQKAMIKMCSFEQ